MPDLIDFDQMIADAQRRKAPATSKGYAHLDIGIVGYRLYRGDKLLGEGSLEECERMASLDYWSGQP